MVQIAKALAKAIIAPQTPPQGRNYSALLSDIVNCVSRAMAILLEISDFQQRSAMHVPCTNKYRFSGGFYKNPLSL